MAQLARSIDATAHQVSLPSSPAALLRLSGAGDVAGSPARDLHERLLRSFEPAAQSAEERLPLNTRLAIIAGSISVPWVAIGTVIYFVLA